MKDDTEDTSRYLIRSRPRLRLDSAFTAKVMAEIRVTKVKRFLPWRKLTIGLGILLVSLCVGAGLLLYLHLQPDATMISSSNSYNNSLTNNSQKSGSTTTPNYGLLNVNAQSDINAMSLQTGKFSDSDYADSQLADSQIY